MKISSTHRADAQISSKSNWLVPLGLIAIAFVPILAGVFRLMSLASAPLITTENLRFFVSPGPVILHIIGATIFCVFGATQFSPGLRMMYPEWHRGLGRAVVAAGFITAFSGIWMAQFYAIVPEDNILLHIFRLSSGFAMAACIMLGLMSVVNGRVRQHGAWMRRAYAIGLGAGTQALTQLPIILVFGKPNEMTYTLMMGAAWVLNIGVAECLIKRQKTRLTNSAAA